MNNCGHPFEDKCTRTSTFVNPTTGRCIHCGKKWVSEERKGRGVITGTVTGRFSVSYRSQYARLNWDNGL
jgi:hypothetical protein